MIAWELSMNGSLAFIIMRARYSHVTV